MISCGTKERSVIFQFAVVRLIIMVIRNRFFFRSKGRIDYE